MEDNQKGKIKGRLTLIILIAIVPISVITFLAAYKTGTGVLNVYACLAVIVIALILTGALLNFLMGKLIGTPLKELKNMAAEISEGNIYASSSYKRENDIGDTIESLRNVSAMLSNMYENAIQAKELAMQGRLRDVDIDDSGFKGTYNDIIRGFLHLIRTFTSYFDALSIPVSLMDNEFNIVFANKAYVKLAKVRNKENIIGKKCYECMEVDCCKTDECPGSRSLQSGEEQSGQHATHNAEWCYLLHTVPFYDEDGNIIGFMESAIDQTQNVMAQNATENQADQIVQQIEISKKQTAYQHMEVGKLLENLEKLGDGKLDLIYEKYEFDQDTKGIYDLFQRINLNLEMSCNTIKGYIFEVTSVLQKIANKDLDIGIDREFHGDFASIKESINSISENLNEIFGQIISTIAQVESASGNVANSSYELSRGVLAQETAIEQISDIIAKLSEQTRLNADSAEKADHISLSAKEDAELGNVHMNEMISAMEGINEASRSIATIIKVIDDIAFQTDILALNAAVESARAGEHGKGFSVVAEEVRTLASRSAAAAKETTTMITTSLERVDNGAKIAQKTAEALQKIVGGVEDTVQIVGTIAESSSRQAHAIEQLDKSIGEIAKVTKNTTATAEQSAHASEEMAGQAASLKKIIEQFHIKADLK